MTPVKSPAQRRFQFRMLRKEDKSMKDTQSTENREA